MAEHERIANASPSEGGGHVQVVSEAGADLFADVIDALPVATLVLDRAGIVTVANRASCDLLQLGVDQIVGEPVLGWISRASEREAFGRSFLTLRRADSGKTGFVLGISLRPALGPAVRCVVRSSKLKSGHVALTCHPETEGDAPEAELGRAVTRSLDAMDQGVVLVNGEARVVHANPAGEKLLGGTLVGRSLLELADPDVAERLTRALAMGRAGSWQGELELRRVDGEPLAVELSLAAGAGAGAPAVVLVRDLRERRRREFEDRLVAQIDRCLVASAEPRLSVMGACAALANAMQAERVSVVAKVAGGWERWVLQGETPSPVERLAEGTAPPESWATATDVELVEVDDPTIVSLFGPSEDGRGGAKIALVTPTGAVGHVLLVHRRPAAWDSRDRTLVGLLGSQIALGLAHGLLTLEARALAAYQAMVLDQTSVLLDSVDAEGRIVTWNRASEQLLVVDVEDALGRRFGVDVAKSSDPTRWATLWETLLRDGVISSELTVVAGDGAEVPLHLEGRLLRDDGVVRGAVLVGLDLRDRRALERQILRSQKLAAVGLLAAGIAHEINNPLSGVVGYSKLLLEQKLRDDVREKVEKVAQSGRRCQKIVEGVLLFSRQQEGGKRRRVDLRTVLDRVLAIGEYQWRMHNIRIIREVDEQVEIQADSDQIEQVLLNLLSNAVDAMPRGGTVRLALRRQNDGSGHLEVADEGTGIPEDLQARIFDPFFSTKEIGKGTGLGLAISYGIVQDHGGDILLESEPGRGSTFTVILPADGNPKDPNRPESTESTLTQPPQQTGQTAEKV